MDKWEYLVRIIPVGPGSPEADSDMVSFLNDSGQNGYRFRQIANYQGDFVLVMEKQVKDQ